MGIYKASYAVLSAMLAKDRICFAYVQTSNKFINLPFVYNRMEKTCNCVKINGDEFSLKNIYQLARAKIVLLDQSTKLLSNLRIHGDTTCIQLWHSSGLYKKVGFDAPRRGYSATDEYKRIRRIHSNIDFFIISDEKLIPFYTRAFSLPKEKILPLGLVRTDKYYSIDINANLDLIHQRYPWTQGRKILLYAPTFRHSYGKSNRKSVNYLDIDKLKSNLGDEWCFAFRRHPSLQGNENESKWLDFSDLDQDVCLSAADILVTDYSSILFDFSFFKRPILCFIPDMEEYEKTQRGLYVTPEELVTESCVCHTTDALIQIMKRMEFPEHHIWERFMNNCDGHSCERVVAFIKDSFMKNGVDAGR